MRVLNELHSFVLKKCCLLVKNLFEVRSINKGTSCGQGDRLSFPRGRDFLPAITANKPPIQKARGLALLGKTDKA
jgi:hypothetical protein